MMGRPRAWLDLAMLIFRDGRHVAGFSLARWQSRLLVVFLLTLVVTHADLVCDPRRLASFYKCNQIYHTEIID